MSCLSNQNLYSEDFNYIEEITGNYMEKKLYDNFNKSHSRLKPKILVIVYTYSVTSSHNTYINSIHFPIIIIHNSKPVIDISVIKYDSFF